MARKQSSGPADIYAAARAGDLGATRAFLDTGAKADAVSDYGFTALECAAILGAETIGGGLVHGAFSSQIAGLGSGSASRRFKFALNYSRGTFCGRG